MDPDPSSSKAICVPDLFRRRLNGESKLVLDAGCQKFIWIMQKNRSLGKGEKGGRVESRRGNVVCLNERKHI